MCAAKKWQTSRESLDAAAVGHFSCTVNFANPTSERPTASWSVLAITQDEPYAQLVTHTFLIAVGWVGGEEVPLNQSCDTGTEAKKAA